MSGVCKINIIESAETLKTLLSQQKTASGKERVQALYLLKTKQVEIVQHLAVVMGRDAPRGLARSGSHHCSTVVAAL